MALCNNCQTVLCTLYSKHAPRLVKLERWYTFPCPSRTCELCDMMVPEIPREKLERGGLAKISFNASLDVLKGWVGGELVFAFLVQTEGGGREDGSGGWSLKKTLGWARDDSGKGCAIPGRGGLDVEHLAGWPGLPIFVEDSGSTTKSNLEHKDDDRDGNTVEQYRNAKKDRERVGLARKWIGDCHEGHKSCKPHRECEFTPSRLVDVERWRLVDTTTKESLLSGPFKYAAFTYVWGPPTSMPESAQTTTQNLSSHLESIDFSSLPRAFRAALVITKSLGIPYLWIDALCILQDSVLDWEEQCSQMGMVYNNAYLTISASSITSCHDAIPLTREAPTSCKFTLEYPSNHQVNFSISPTPPTWQKFLERSPLSKRGWTFQERELSPRILHFSPDQIRYECRTSRLLESPLPSHDHIIDPVSKLPTPVEVVNLSAPRRIIESKHEKDKDQFLARLYGAPGKASLQLRCLDTNVNLWTPLHASASIAQKFFITEARFNTWHRTITEFSSRSFTSIDDRLPALSGLASEMQVAYGGQYVAGMWGGDLLRSLLWRRASAVDISIPRSEIYRGPSWSWVAIDETVSYDLVTLNRPQIDKLDSCTAHIEDINIVPAGLDRYGRLKSGYIDVKGRLKIYTPSSLSRDAEFYFDFLDETEGREVYLLSLFASRSGSVGTRGAERDLKTIWALALVLLRDEGVPVFKRVGVVGGLLAEWFEDAGVRGVRVV